MKTMTYLCCLVMLVAVSTGCERWGGRLDSLESESSSGNGSGKGSGNGGGSSTSMGSLYGDLLYILRDEDGLPTYKNGFVQPLAFKDGEPYLYTYDGQLLQYVCDIDSEGEIVENVFVDILGNVAEIVDGSTYGPMEVEFGRTSIFRAPQKVLDNAFAEAMSGLSEIKELNVDYCGRLYGVKADGSEKTIDSPRENIAVYQSIIENDGFDGIISYCNGKGYTNLANLFSNWGRDYLFVAAGTLGAANDKTGTVSVDKVMYINGFKDLVGDAFLTDTEGNLFCDYSMFKYDRSDWSKVKLGFLVWNGAYSSEPIVTMSVEDIFGESSDDWGYGTKPSFTVSSKSGLAKFDKVGGFAQYTDDCTQVLEYVHEDSNIVWVK